MNPDSAAALLARLRVQGASVAVAESLTGGLVCAALTAVPGASAVVRGAIVAYATDLKASELAVPERLLTELGPVSEPVAAAMSAAVATRLGADYGLATTGVAGPQTQGAPVGTVFVAACRRGQEPVVRQLYCRGGRDEIRQAAVTAALALLGELLPQ